MKFVRSLLTLVSLVFLAFVSGCGGGGGSDSTSTGGTGSVTTQGATMSGTAMKGPFSRGSPITAFRVVNGRPGPVLGTGTVGNFGSFLLRLNDPNYTGPILFTVSGEFASETGGTDTISESNPLYGFLPSGSGRRAEISIAITPLTNLAFTLAQARGALTATSLQAALDEIGARFGVANPGRTIPTDPTAATGSADSPQLRYGLVLAGLTQQARTLNVSTEALLQSLASDASDGTLDGLATSPAIAGYGSQVFTTGLAGAIDTFVASSNNVTSVTDTPTELRGRLTRAQIVIGGLQLPPAAARGQTIKATLRLTNIGGNSARISVLEVSTSHEGVSISPDQATPSELGAGIATELQFTISVSQTAPAGAPVFRATVSAADATTSEPAGSTRENAGSFSIQEPSRLVIGNIVLPATVVRGGTFDVQVPVVNGGGSPATILTSGLTFSRPGFFVTTQAGNPVLVDPSEAVALRYRVSVDSNAPSGTVTITATVRASDGVASQQGTATLRVLSAAQLEIGTIAASSTAVEGQTFQVQVGVKNNGETRAQITFVQLSFGTTDLTAVNEDGNPTSIAPGVTATYRFRVTAGANTAGRSFTAAVTVEGADEASGLPLNTSRSNAGTLQVVRPSTLTITGLALPAAVSIGQTFVATVSVRNTGQSTADIGAVNLTFNNPGVTPQGLESSPTFILPGQIALFRIRVLVASNAAVGPTAGSVSVTAVDRLSGASASTSAQNLASVNVLSRAGLFPVSILMQALVSKGQSAVATLTLQNSGQSDARVTAASISFSNPGLSGTARSDNPQLVPGNGTAALRFDVNVSPTAPSGISTIGATVSGTDTRSGAAIGGSIADGGSTLVQEPAALTVTAVAAPARVSQGQTFVATSLLRNDGEASARITAASLTFSSPDVTAVLQSPSPLPILSRNQSVTLRFACTVGASATRGPVTAVLATQGIDINSNAVPRASLPTALSLTVDTPASVSVRSLALSTGIVSIGQSLQAFLTLRNSGSATAVLTGVSLQLGGLGLTAAAGNQRSLAGDGALTTYTFNVSAAAATAGTTLIGSRVTGFDQNSGFPLAVPQAATRPALLVQTKAALSVTALTIPNSKMTQGQTRRISLTLKNDGQATARLSSVRLLFDRALLSAAPQSNVVNILGGASGSFDFDTTASPTSAGVVKVDGDATAIDSNSGAAVSVARTRSLTVTVQAPAVLALTEIRTRSSYTLGQTTRVTLVFANQGESSLTITTATGVPSQGSVLQVGFPVPFRGSVNLAGGASSGATIQVTMSVLSTDRATLSSATVTAREDNTGRLLPLVNALALPPTFRIQEAPQISMKKPILPATVSRGQTFTATALVSNSGEAPLRITALDVLTTPSIETGPITPSIPAVIAGFTTAPIEFRLTVAEAATLGAARLDISATGIDDNTGVNPMTATTLNQGPILVQSRPSLRIAPYIKQSTASLGQQFIVTLPVFNDGQATANITNATLVWSDARVTSAVDPTNLTTVPGGGRRDFRMIVSVGSQAATTGTTARATVSAIDVNSGLAITQATTNSTDATVIQRPAKLSIKTFRTQQFVSQGQSFVATVGVKNEGGARARITGGSVTFSRSGITSTLTGPATPTFVEPSVTVPLTFTCAVDSGAALGLTTADVAVSANDANGDSLDITTFAARIGSTTVQSPGVLVVTALGTPATMSQNQTVRVSLTVSNTGQSRITLEQVNLTAPPTLTVSADGANVTSIAGGTTAQFFFSLTAPAAETPRTTSIGFSLLGRDVNNSTVTVSLANSAFKQLTIQRPPQPTLGDLVSPPSTVSQGQKLFLRLPISNPPDAAAALFNGPSLTGSPAGITAVTTPPSPSQVRTGQTTHIVFLATIDATAAPGTMFVAATVPFTDANTGNPGSIQRNPVANFNVQTAAKLSLSSTLPRTSVTQGQGFTVDFTITNSSGASGAAATGTAAAVTRSDTTFGASVAQPSPTIQGGSFVTSTLTVSTSNPSTTLGTKTATVTYTANDANSGISSANTTVTSAVRFVVQARPTLVASTPSLATTISRGEVKVPVSLTLTNTTANGAPVKVTGATLRFLANGVTDDSANYTQTAPAVLPVIAAGKSATLGFLVNVNTAALLGPVSVTANVTAQDNNDNTSLTVAAPASFQTTVVAARPVLRLAGALTDALPALSPAGKTLSTGQTQTFAVTVRNFGAAAAVLGSSPALSFFSGFVNKTSEYTSTIVGGAGATVPAASGGTTTGVTVSFNVTPSNSATAFGTIQVGANVPATASVGGANVSTSVTPPSVSAGSFALQQAVNAQQSDLLFDPVLPSGVDRASSTTSADLAASAVIVRLRINNPNGLNGANLVASNIALKMQTGTDLTSQYSISPTTRGPVTIAGNGTAVVTFSVAALPTATKFALITVTPRMTAQDANKGTSSSVTLNGVEGTWVVREKASALLGQPDFVTSVASPATASRLSAPLAVASDGVRRIVADTQNSRVLIFPSLTATTATTVLGQADFTSGSVNAGGAASARTLNTPSGVAVKSNRLIVADSGNNRVLIYNNLSALASNAAASNVIGQANFTSTNPNRGGAVNEFGLSSPRGVAVVGDTLVVSDTGNNRVLTYGDFSEINDISDDGRAAINVIGQGTKSESAVNRNSSLPSGSSLAFPAGLGTDGQRLFIADAGNDRVLVYFTVPSSDGATANRVLGYASLISSNPTRPTSQGSLDTPTGIAAAGQLLFVSDAGNNRVMVFSNPNLEGSFVDGAPAVDMFGQRFFTNNLANNTVSGSRDAFSLSNPGAVATTSTADSGRALVVDTNNNRVLVVPIP